MADILLVEDEEVLRRSLVKALERSNHEVRSAESAEAALALVEDGPPDLLITDQRMPGMSGHELLIAVKAAHPHVGVILITAHGTIEGAVAAMRDGAMDYLRKPIDLHEFTLVVSRCLEQTGLRRELEYYRSRDLATGERDGIIGSSLKIERLRDVITRLASLEKRDGGGPTILLAGETGTGKGLAARAIHNRSRRADRPFIEVNCSAIPENLLEAELMGFEKGAFTDASAAKAGLFEAAEGGTIFLDELGHMPVRLQSKLLKVIDEKIVRRLGSTRDRSVSCTIISATHMDLEQMVADGGFLEDLYHRLNVVRVALPALRERENDVLTLAEHFMSKHAQDYGVEIPSLGADAVAVITNHAWPGNVRELSHAIERAIVLGVGRNIAARDLALSPSEAPHSAVGVRDEVSVDFTAGPIDLERIESELIRRAMEFTGANQARSARLLGLSRDALRYRLEKFGLR